MVKLIRNFKFVFVFLILSTICIDTVKASTNDATLFFNPTSATATVGGSNFNIVARINPGSNTVEGINAVQLDVTFAPSVMHLASFTASSPFNVMAAPNIGIVNASGKLSVALFIPASQVTTISDVATLVFQPYGAGTAVPISFDQTANATVNDGEGTTVVGTRTNAVVTVSSPADSTPPTISAGSPVGTLQAGTTQTVVSLTTDENANCKYDINSGVSYSSMANLFTSSGETTHSFVASGLSNGGSYGYFVRCQDLAGNANSSDYLISFSVMSPPQIVTPIVSNNNDNNDDNNSSHKDKKSSPARSIANSRKTVTRGTVIIQRGKKFSKNTFINLYFSKAGGGYYPPTKIKTSSTGAFSVSYRVNKPKGKYGWYAVDTKTGRKSKTVYYSVK